MTEPLPRAVGVNHVALDVGDVDAAVAFYRSIVHLELRGREPGMAFLDLGDQFIALSERREARHFGLVVDDRRRARAALERAGAEILPGHRLDFLDPWGNHVQVVEYGDVQFTKAPRILEGMALGHLGKSDAARRELAGKGLG
jgi:catechol 2,3-dioxygenase-like lactoylglutathione lyase family enzyme